MAAITAAISMGREAHEDPDRRYVAGIALFGTIGKGLATALLEEGTREPALITFLVTASGVTLLGIGSAFWGLLAGGDRTYNSTLILIAM